MVLGSFVAITVGRELCIEDCFRVVVWQVFVLSWAGKLDLVVERLPVQLPFDYRNPGAFRVPFDEAFAPDCDLAGSDDLPGLPVERPSPTDADSHSTNGASLMERVDFVVPNEIVAGIGIAVEFHATILGQVVGLPDSSRGVGADAIAVAADDFEGLESSEIVGFVECRWEANQRALDSVNDRSLSDPTLYDYILDVEPMMSENSDAELRSHRKRERELAVVASGTFDVRFVHNVEIFSAGLAVGAVTEEEFRSLVAVSYRSSYSVVMNRLLASVSDPEDIHSCVDDNYKRNEISLWSRIVQIFKALLSLSLSLWCLRSWMTIAHWLTVRLRRDGLSSPTCDVA